MKLSELLKKTGLLDSQKRIKVARHKDRERDLWQLVRDGTFEEYQNCQGWDPFNCDYVISFIAEKHCMARFVGVWEVLGKSPHGEEKGHVYETKKVPILEDLSGRLVVNWGSSTRSWVQVLDKKGDKEIFEILPAGYIGEFPWFYDVLITYEQLLQLVLNQRSNREWVRMLKSVNGVYLISDITTGEVYVGSAYGKGGIFARWSAYARTVHGGNKLLRDKLERDPDCVRRFKYSIVRVFEYGTPKEEVISHESLVKEKIGARAWGLNAN